MWGHCYRPSLRQDPGPTVSEQNRTSPSAAAPAAKTPRLPLQGFLLLALLSAIWGVNWPIMKTALTEVPVLSFRALCLMAGGAALLAIARAAGYPIALRRDRILVSSGVALFNITGWHILCGYAVILIPSGHAAIIGYTMPVWGVILGAIVLHEPLTWRRLLSLGLGMAGLGVLITADMRGVEGVPIGVLLMAAAALCWAIGTVGMKKVDWRMPTAVVVAWQCLIGGLPILAGAILFDREALIMPSLWPLLATLYNIVFSFIIGHYLFYKVVSLFPVGIATIGTLAIPVIGLFSGALLLGEPLGAVEFGALALVACALAIPVLTQPHGLRTRLRRGLLPL